MKMATESDVLSEIEVLQSIYLEELRVSRKSDRDWDVSVDLYPSTAEDSLSQFVRLTLTLTMDSQYPSSAPSISIHNPRGLSDDKLLSVRRCLEAEAQACLGTPVLYQLIQKAKEILTESNIPHGSCAICLYGFKVLPGDGEVFTKTGCYHYFHSHCLGRYAAHSESELQERAREREEDKTRGRTEGQELSVVCPVCREPLTYDLELLLNSPTPHFPKTEETVLGPEFRKKWAKLQSILERQRERGGVIDPEAESSRFLIHINQPPADAGSVAPDPDSPPSPPLPASTNQVTASQGPQPSSQSERRAGSGGRRRGQSRWSRRREAQPEPRGHPHGLSEEGVAKLSLSSGRDPARQPRPAETARAERSGEISRPHAVAHGDAHGGGQQRTLNQSCPDILKSNSQADPVPGRGRGQRHGQWGRGRRRGSGQQPRRLEERHVHGPDAPREGAPHWGVGYRGRRGGDHYTHFRGGGDNRKSGRGFTQREAESEVAGGEGP